MSKEDQGQAWARGRKFLAGYMSGVCLVLAGHPFDTIKVRMQSEGRAGRFGGVMDCVKQTVRHEGLRGMYKGMSAPLFMTGVINSVLFGTQYNLVNEIANRRREPGGATPTPTLRETMAAAVASGALISLLVTPMEGIKARLQVQYHTGGRYSGPLDCARTVYREMGLVNGIYRGWLPVCLCRMSNYAYFGSYALISTSLASFVNDGDSVKKPLPFWAALLAGGSSGLCYCLSCYPVDVVKNRIQAAPDNADKPMYKNMRHAFATIYRKEGIRGFFVGFSPCVIRAFPANAAAFCGFELAMRFLPE